jgi:serine/threonine-protein kinase
VALKQIQVRHAGNRDSRSRFLREAEITGRLEHPGIVPVYGLGRHADGGLYYVMRFIEGRSLQQAINQFHGHQKSDEGSIEGRLELRQLLGRFVDACNAIAYAHSRGVLHRDVKPDNIMLGEYGETLVVDWGLAKAGGRSEWASGSAPELIQPSTGSDLGVTQAGSVLGTPRFMSPEQAAGDLDRLGPASDVYSLGVTLYCLLTGDTPFDGVDVATVLAKVQRGEFQRPRQANCEVPTGLETICLKAMALSSEDRYPSALALANAIERWLADEPLSVYQDQIVTISSDGRFTSISPSFEARFGWARGEWLGKPFAGMIHPDDLPLCMRLFQGALQGETPPVFKTRVLTKCGQYLTEEISVILQALEGKVVGVMALVRAVSSPE